MFFLLFLYSYSTARYMPLSFPFPPSLGGGDNLHILGIEGRLSIRWRLGFLLPLCTVFALAVTSLFQLLFVNVQCTL